MTPRNTKMCKDSKILSFVQNVHKSRWVHKSEDAPCYYIVITYLPLDYGTNPDWSSYHADYNVNNSDWLRIVMVTTPFHIQ